MPFIAFIISPFGRLVAIGAVMAAISVGVYIKVRKDAVEQHLTRQHMQEIKRLQNALDADDRVRRSLAGPDGLRADDGFRRD